VTGGRSTVPTLPIPLLQDAVARQVARFSLRRVAREVSMSPNGLRDFLRGATPRSSTRGKLERWLAAQGQVTRPPNVGQFVRLLAELSSDLSPQQTEQLGREIAALLVRSYEARRLSPPRWVQELLRHYRPRRRKAAAAGEVA
jgi:transcriptional regulator with XRE-family HTH domain